MKYHYQHGIIEKDKKTHPKFWLGFFLVLTVATYSTILFASLSLNGWPLYDVAATAKIVKTTQPNGSNKVLIPAINMVASENTIKLSGDPSYGDTTVSGADLGFGITPDSLRQASPFYNLAQLKTGDEIFLDSQGVRYVYKVDDHINKSEQRLIIKSTQKTITAKTIGTIAWNNGKPNVESF